MNHSVQPSCKATQINRASLVTPPKAGYGKMTGGIGMATFFMFGKYSHEALKKISPERTRKAINTIQKFGGRVKSVYAMLGGNDLVFIVTLPGAAQATMVSIALTKLTGISFSTSEAIPVDQFDKLAKEM